MTFRRTLLATVASVALVTGFASSNIAVAQESAPSLNTAGNAQAADFDEPTLDSFAAAFLKVNQIGQTYEAQLQAAKTPEEQQKIQTEAKTEMQAAVSGTAGMDLDTYNKIIQVAQADPNLADRINKKLNTGAPAGATGAPPPADGAAPPAAPQQ